LASHLTLDQRASHQVFLLNQGFNHRLLPASMHYVCARGNFEHDSPLTNSHSIHGKLTPTKHRFTNRPHIEAEEDLNLILPRRAKTLILSSY
jgi:hypothetical protein